MGLEQSLRSESEVKPARRGYIEAIIVDAHRDGAASDTVVPVADRVCDRFAECFGGVQWFVHPFEYARQDTACDGQGLPEKPAAEAKKLEGVPVKLPIVQELGSGGAPKPGNPQGTLAVLGLEAR